MIDRVGYGKTYHKNNDYEKNGYDVFDSVVGGMQFR